MAYKIQASIQNLNETVSGYTYDFVVSESSLCKTGQLREVPSEHTGSQPEIERYLVSVELGELDGSHLLLLTEED